MPEDGVHTFQIFFQLAISSLLLLKHLYLLFIVQFTVEVSAINYRSSFEYSVL